MSVIKNVTIVGASGSLGSVILEKLLASGKFNVRVLRRPSSRAIFPPGVEVINVSLMSLEDLTTALVGQDAVVSAVGTSQVPEQMHLVDACVAAGVHRFIPAEFGADLENAKVQSLPVYIPHVKIRNEIITKSRTSYLTYTFVHNGAFLDWGLQYDFILRISDYMPLILDNGEHVFSATTVGSIADALVGILDHPGETKNRAVYIEDIKITQNKLLELARIVAPHKPWAPTSVSLDALTAAADSKVSQGNVSEESMIPYLYRALMDPECGGDFKKTDNQLLGLKGITEEDVFHILKRYIK